MTNLNLTFGETILILRRRKGWTANEASAMVGITQANYSRLETGKSVPRRKTINNIAEVFGYPAGELAALLKKEMNQ